MTTSQTSCALSITEGLWKTLLTNTSSTRIVGVLVASITLPPTNSWFTGALAGCLITNATVTIHRVGKHTVTF